MKPIKTSYGIICCRSHPSEGFQIILVKKPYTYQFCDFVMGKYYNEDDKLIELFNNMTYHEKIDIMSLKFNVMWYRLYKKDPDSKFTSINDQDYQKQYSKNKAKFESLFVHSVDGTSRLYKLIALTINSETIWEIPKGRRNDDHLEKPINTAIREFSEETSIKKESYDLHLHIKPYIESYFDNGIIYKNVYYFATANSDLEPSIKFSNDMQISEVAAIGWCGSKEINAMKLHKITHKRIITMFYKIKDKYKKSTNIIIRHQLI